MIPAIVVVVAALAIAWWFNRPLRCPKCRQPVAQPSPMGFINVCDSCGKKWVDRKWTGGAP